MAYQQPPYQSTEMRPVVVVKPELPVQQSDRHETGTCILCIGVLGGMIIIASFLLLMVSLLEFTTMGKLRGSFHTVFMIGIILGLLGVGMVTISCCVGILGYKKFKKKLRSQENSVPQYEPFTDTENLPGYVSSRQGQPNVGQSVVGTGNVAYPGPPSYSVPERGLAPEYDQQSAYAPPRYSP